MAAVKGGLGRGLDALFQDNIIENESGVVTLRLSEIKPNHEQPRKHFDEAELLELADSIREHGVLQPLIVRPMLGGEYQLIAGERRYRAAMIAQVSTVPVVIREFSDMQAMEVALVENLQRRDLNPVEEGEGYKALAEQFSLTQAEIAQKVGKSRSAVANAMRLCELPNEVKKAVSEGSISMGHARALLSLQETEQICSAAAEVIAKGLSVRQTEQMVAKLSRSPRPEKMRPRVDSYYKELQIALEKTWGRKVRISPSTENAGSITVDYVSREDLIELTERLTGKKIDSTEY
ncbi:MAG: ParB/RepB/Spo0J family partition protein [Oscillospiraceae bacterium]|nr:ParB/RepB/Spo0J family partition protein [Oscillospiraceae bacterium]